MPFFLQFDVVFLCETWVTGSTVPELAGFDAHCSPAIRAPGRGRPSGGLAMYTRAHLRGSLTSRNDQSIIMEVVHQPPLLLAGIYLNPSQPISVQLTELRETLQCVHHGQFLIMGDFNCRIGNYPNKLDTALPSSGYLSTLRVSSDGERTARGSALIRFIDSEALVILNGRTHTDDKGDFTFVSSIGRSVVDLAICSQATSCLISDGGMMELASGSDHFPVFCRLLLSHSRAGHSVPQCSSSSSKVFRWNPLMKYHYNNRVQSLVVQHSSSNTAVPFHRLHSAIVSSAEELAMCTTRRPPRTASKNPWFNRTCQLFKRCRQNALAQMRASRYLDEETRHYVFLRRMYDCVLAWAKAEYYAGQLNSLIAAKDSKEFWGIIRKISPRTTPQSQPLSCESIVSHFTSVFQRFQSSPPLNLPPNLRVLALDSSFSLAELDQILAKSPPGKAPGIDGVGYEFYCGMDYESRLLLLDCFNHILEKEQVPKDWCKLKMFLLHKKGDQANVENYRGITLLNSVAKLFTAMIAGRLTRWADSENIMPECQSGFRPGRSCIDNLFVLLTVVNLHLRVPGTWLFVAFVDFKQAFDSVDHNVLWRKLWNYGCSNKIINLLRSLYTSASVSVHHNDTATDPISIRNGVLQGDCLSPLLFCFMLADFEEFLVMKGIDGVGLGPNWLIRCLFFADDLVMFARTRARMQEALNALEEYCALNLLTVNAAKTKVVVFREKRTLQVRPFRLGAQDIQVADEYTYLGITFSANGGFEAHEMALKRRVTSAAVPISELISKLPGSDLKVISTLFSSKVSSIALYGAEIWALWSLHRLEQLQEQFYKKLFYLHNTTPGYVLRQQFQLQHLSAVVCARALKWANRVRGMEPVRWPHRCLVRLCHLDASQKRLNWVHRLCELTGVPLSTEQTNVAEWLSNITGLNAAEDLARCESSSHCTTYARVVPARIFASPGQSFAEQRLAMQLLMHNARFESIYWRGLSAKFANGACCHCLNGRDTLEHVMTACSSFGLLRRDCFGSVLVTSLPDLLKSHGLDSATRFLKLAWPMIATRTVLPVQPTSRPD